MVARREIMAIREALYHVVRSRNDRVRLHVELPFPLGAAQFTHHRDVIVDIGLVDLESKRYAPWMVDIILVPLPGALPSASSSPVYYDDNNQDESPPTEWFDTLEAAVSAVVALAPERIWRALHARGLLPHEEAAWFDAVAADGRVYTLVHVARKQRVRSRVISTFGRRRPGALLPEHVAAHFVDVIARSVPGTYLVEEASDRSSMTVARWDGAGWVAQR